MSAVYSARIQGGGTCPPSSDNQDHTKYYSSIVFSVNSVKKHKSILSQCWTIDICGWTLRFWSQRSPTFDASGCATLKIFFGADRYSQPLVYLLHFKIMRPLSVSLFPFHPRPICIS